MPLPAGDLLQQPGAYRVGPVQRAAADHGEVRLQGAHVGAVLDAPHQVVVGGLVLVDDRRTATLGMGDDDVDPIAGAPGFVGVRRGREGPG